MNDLNEELGRRLSRLRDAGLYRELRRLDSPQSPHIEIDGQPLLNFSSNDYLGLANDPQLKQAAIETVERYGCGSGASPLICGRLLPHDQLEQTLAAFKRTEAALCFSSGYAAALGTICALLDKDDVIVIDKLVHASIVDAARLCRAKLRVFAHNDLTKLHDILSWVDRRNSSASSVPATVPSRRPYTLIVTESVFSMDGDHAALGELVALKEKFGAWLMVDEAHATGLYGRDGRGLAEAEGVADRIEIQMGTLGKALGASGGYVCGSRTLIDYLVNRARSFIFSTAAVPAAAAAATAGIEFLKTPGGEQRRTQLWQRVDQILSPKDPSPNADSLGRARATSTKGSRDSHIPYRSRSAIVPILIGDENEALRAAARLREQKIFIPAIRYPTVARGQARLRLTVTAAHSAADVAQLLTALDLAGVSLEKAVEWNRRQPR
jgi:8-amino-7-oxononanoate synthase